LHQAEIEEEKAWKARMRAEQLMTQAKVYQELHVNSNRKHKRNLVRSGKSDFNDSEKNKRTPNGISNAYRNLVKSYSSSDSQESSQSDSSDESETAESNSTKRSKSEKSKTSQKRSKRPNYLKERNAQSNNFKQMEKIMKGIERALYQVTSSESQESNISQDSRSGKSNIPQSQQVDDMLGDLQEKSSLQDSEQQEDSKPIIFDSKASLMSENEEPSGLEGSKPEDHKKSQDHMRSQESKSKDSIKK